MTALFGILGIEIWRFPARRSGKIIRRVLRSLAAGEEFAGDISTLEDRSVLDKLRGGSCRIAIKDTLNFRI